MTALGGPTVNEEAVKELADGYLNFQKINQDAESSQHGNASTVNFWVPRRVFGNVQNHRS